MDLLFYLFCGHFVADFPLQTEWIAKHKNRRNISKPPPGQALNTIWPYVLTAHAATHGAAVALVTGSATLGMAEAVLHWVIDFAKCENWTNIHTDQFLHFACKLVWWWAIGAQLC